MHVDSSKLDISTRWPHTTVVSIKGLNITLAYCSVAAKTCCTVDVDDELVSLSLLPV
jgi:hypothetical protein